MSSVANNICLITKAKTLSSTSNLNPHIQSVAVARLFGTHKYHGHHLAHFPETQLHVSPKVPECLLAKLPNYDARYGMLSLLIYLSVWNVITLVRPIKEVALDSPTTIISCYQAKSTTDHFQYMCTVCTVTMVTL